MEPGLSIFEVMYVVVQHKLKTDDEATLEVVDQRLVQYTKDRSSTSDAMEIEGAVKVLDLADHKLVKDQQDEADKQVIARSYVGGMRKARIQATRGKNKGSYKKNVGNLPSIISQSQAKTYLPNNSVIWRDVKRGAWCCHVKPYSRIRELWERHGSDHAALIK